MFIENDLEVTVEGRNEISLKDVKEFPRSRLSIKSCIGKGAFSFVYKAKAVGILHPYDITPVAVKILKGSYQNIQNYQKYLIITFDSRLL